MTCFASSAVLPDTLSFHRSLAAPFPPLQWTGYFVSRSALKAYVRESSSVFQAAKLAQVFAGGAPDVSPANPLYRFER